MIWNKEMECADRSTCLLYTSSLSTEKAFLLTDNGFELDYMDIKYTCPHCKDTGILETGERCQCFGEVTKEKIQLIRDRKAV